MLDRRRATILLGETARDIGILLFVFGPLDALFQNGGPGMGIVIVLIPMALISIAVGIMLEAWTPQI